MLDPVTVAAYAPDLIDRSKISAAVPDCRFVSTPEALVGLAGVDTVIVDLRQPRAAAVLPDLHGVRVIAYGSHVDKEALQAARDAGCEEVLPRSAFFSRLPNLLS